MVRQRYTDYNNDSIFKCPQEDNIQREGVISFREEAQLIKRASVNLNNYDFSNEVIEPDYNQKETLDIIGEKKELDKMIKNNKKEYEKEKKILEDKITEEHNKYLELQYQQSQRPPEKITQQ